MLFATFKHAIFHNDIWSSGVLYAFCKTTNHHPWIPGYMDSNYAIFIYFLFYPVFDTQGNLISGHSVQY